MATTYTIEELYSFEKNACLPEGVDLQPFLNLVATVTEILRHLDETFPRRKSFNHSRPQKKKQPKEIVDEDGWTTLVTEKHANEDPVEGTVNSDSAVVEESTETEPAAANNKKGKPATGKIRINAAKISSGKSSVGDARDTIAITQVSKFNAFDALALDDDE
ncbi:hypothetical protein CAS74_001676 [Pichia kudriavzevii]|uniref:Cap-associated protein CAF20 n=1 Tax=Pichia kudriavzevii TaxID=4909 RepID=A0A1Z8JRX0_PICKU|nr:uncharacterized protein C5L36_0A04710 [Pichia kudriavzevii]AWU73873.1 hypothetical protein C5L36_0A04710 [Pichia kudriavzevii]OUT23358.1 hypothetical protein CAS74_001676 [Pichia kudriavzevii]